MFHLSIFDDSFGNFEVCEDCFSDLYQKMEQLVLEYGFQTEEV